MTKEKATKKEAVKKTATKATKSEEKKTKTEKDEKKVAEKKVVFGKDEKYYYGVGRRKTSVAQVRIYPDDKAGENSVVVNDRKMSDYFLRTDLQAIFLSPLREVGLQDKFKISVLVKGGGISGQAEAAKLGVARALIKFDEELRAVLKAGGFLTRDARKVERKKPGLKKARRAPQWSKR